MAGGSQYVQRIFENIGMGADRTSSVIEMAGKEVCGVQLDWTGTPVGVWLFEASNDYGSQGSNAHWTAFTLDVTPDSPAGAADSVLIDLSYVPWAFIRITFDRTSGTSSDLLNGWVVGKGE